ncbi:uncharacterized protein si:dkey-21c1.4 [Erpetoichthys calabaricus]|uniref:ATP synthase subunit f, mitochondrial-like n=1 Tax=Erpetoichthys calabaricus TaxID=27687 RepID=A0A8C4T8M0_ERPCA|nr:uncharacterized protein si:dkey-21c1.4 [Erpetoichthys calabaricus]
MEVCPFCGKSFKRLKSHLPHCKAAPSAQSKITSPPNRHAEQANTRQKKNLSALSPLSDSSYLATCSITKMMPGNNSKITKPKGSSQISSREKETCVSDVSKDGSWTEGENTKVFQKAKKKKAVSSQPAANTESEVSKSDRAPSLPHKVKPENEAVNGDYANKTSVWNHISHCLIKNGKNVVGRYQMQDIAVSTNERHDCQRQSLFLTKTNVWDHIKDSFCYKKYGAFSLIKNTEVKLGGLQGSVEHQKHVCNGNYSFSLVHPVQDWAIVGETDGTNVITSDETSSMAYPVALSQQRPGVALVGSMEWFPELHAGYSAIKICMVPTKCYLFPQGIHHHTAQEPSSGTTIPHSLQADKTVLDVKIGDLPSWLASRNLAPWAAVAAAQRSWRRYYSKYINVKQGTAGGLTMLLAGYCILSYSWNYQRHKQDRWRKYH